MLELNRIYQGDCLDLMREMPDKSVDLVLTDPPYGLKFMGKEWDHGVPSAQFWKEFSRVCKPGAHLLAFGGTRTHHRLMVAIEDAGWEIRDTLGWMYGSGFPKSLDISKAIEAKILTGSSNKTQFKNLDGEKGIAQLGYSTIHANNDRPNNYNGMEYNKSVNLKTIEGKIWNGWGTALKPAWEPIVLARNPLEGTVAQNVLKWGVGGINIDACRVEYQSESDKASATPQGQCTSKEIVAIGAQPDSGRDLQRVVFNRPEQKGRFPANLIHDGCDEVLEMFPQSKGMSGGGAKDTNKNPDWVVQPFNRQLVRDEWIRCDSGSASRFFYCAKASKSERGEGNVHPTVKPQALIEYLLKLASIEGSIVLDPFVGSGSVPIACKKLNRNFIGIDISQEYCDIAEKRLEKVNNHKITDFFGSDEVST